MIFHVPTQAAVSFLKKTHYHQHVLGPEIGVVYFTFF